MFVWECDAERASFSLFSSPPSSNAKTTPCIIQILQLTTTQRVCLCMRTLSCLLSREFPGKASSVTAWYFPCEPVCETHLKCSNMASQQKETNPERLSIITHVYLMPWECQCARILLHWCCRERRSCNVHQTQRANQNTAFLQQATPTAEKLYTILMVIEENTELWQTREQMRILILYQT